MKVQEYVAKEILRKEGLKVPEGIFLNGSYGKEEIERIKKLGFPQVLKSQVLVGGRMKAGGVRISYSLEESLNVLDELLTKPIKGEFPAGVLIEEFIEHDAEWYFSISIDRSSRNLMYVFSKNGGIDIEEYSKLHPEKIIHTNNLDELPNDIRKTAEKLRNVFLKYDLTLLEINPIGIHMGEHYLLDAVFHVDDNALYRQSWIGKSEDSSVVRLNGDVGVIGCGAGIVMATIDMLKEYGFEPANFCDIGGGATKDELLRAMFEIKEFSNVIVLNIFGGITDCIQIAQGIKEFHDEYPYINLFVRLSGNNEERAKEILKSISIEVAEDMKELVENLLQKKKGGNYYVLERK